MSENDFILVKSKKSGTVLIEEYTGGPDAVIPEGVTRLGAWWWGSLNSLVIASTVKRIDPDAFTKRITLRRLIIPDSVETMSVGSFRGCTGLRDVEVSAQFVEKKWSCCSHELKRGICLTYLLKWLTVAERCLRLENYALKHQHELMMLILDDDDAPALTGLLQIIRQPTPVELDAYQAQAGGTATTAVLMAWRDAHYTQAQLDHAREEWTAKRLGEKPLSVTDWRATLRFVIRDGVATITGCPWGCAELMIPARIGRYPVRIREGAFARQRTLRCVCAEDGLEEIPALAFQFCDGLEEVTLPLSVRRIGARAFENCAGLKAIHAPQAETLPDCACRAEDPQAAVEVGEGAFHGCNGVTRITLSGALRRVPELLLIFCHDLEEVVLEEGIEHIGKGAFVGCFKMRTISLPESLRTIGSKVFLVGKVMDELRIPAGVTEIAEDAFASIYGKRVRLRVTAGSYAHDYAQRHNMRYTIE